MEVLIADDDALSRRILQDVLVETFSKYLRLKISGF